MTPARPNTSRCQLWQAIALVGMLAAASLLLSATAKAQSTSLNYDAIAAATSGPRPAFTDVEGFLAWLSDRNEAQLNHFTLMASSASLQDARPESPRAISFGQRGDLILTFNGHAAAEGGQAIEMMAPVRNAAGQVIGFDLRELLFSASGPQLSESNPGKCLRCHGADPRPLWETYSEWPGSYGARDDAIRPGSETATAFAAFQSLWPTHPRYRWLTTDSSSPVAPFATEMFSPDFSSRPNLHLTKILIRQQSQRAFDRLQQNAACYERHSALLAWALLECRGEDDFKDYGQQLKELLDANWPGRPQEKWYAYDQVKLNELKLALVQFMGLTQGDWTPSRESTYWDHPVADGKHPEASFVLLPLMENLAARHGELMPYVQADDYGYRYPESPLRDGINSIGHPIDHVEANGACPDLKRLAKQALGDRLSDGPVWADCQMPLDEQGEEELQAAPNSLGPLVVKLCHACHQNGVSPAPQFNLTSLDPIEDRSRINEILMRAHPTQMDGDMPPERKLTWPEFQALRRYLLTPR